MNLHAKCAAKCQHIIELPRTCPDCPKYSRPVLSPLVLAQTIVVPQWGTVRDPLKNKDIHCLHPKVLTVSEAFDLLEKLLKIMPTHNFKMYWQWHALAKTKAGLRVFDTATEKDYQVST